MWGVDLGVRSLYVAHISDGTLSLDSLIIPIHKVSRGEELSRLVGWLSDRLGAGQVWIEEPPLAGSRNLRTYLHLSQVSGVVGAVSGSQANYVPVSSWKKGTVGNGSASKDTVSAWLRHVHPGYHAQCSSDQNLIDATCIALFALGQS